MMELSPRHQCLSRENKAASKMYNKFNDVDLPSLRSFKPRGGDDGECCVGGKSGVFRSSYRAKTFAQSDLPELITFHSIEAYSRRERNRLNLFVVE